MGKEMRWGDRFEQLRAGSREHSGKILDHSEDLFLSLVIESGKVFCHVPSKIDIVLFSVV